MALTDSLISFWELGEASGARADSHGTNHLTDNNTVTQVAGKVGDAAQFTRANSEFLSLADNASISVGNIDFTFALWTYLDSEPVADVATMLSQWEGIGNQRSHIIDYLTSADRFRFVISSTGSDAVVATANNLGAVSTATWYFIIGWHDATANTIF